MGTTYFARPLCPVSAIQCPGDTPIQSELECKLAAAQQVPSWEEPSGSVEQRRILSENWVETCTRPGNFLQFTFEKCPFRNS